MTDWRPRPASDLPDGLILFDGVCVMCSAWVDFIIPRDPGGRYRFVPVQSEFGGMLAARFGIDPEAPQSNVVLRDGRACFKADAVIVVGRDLPGWRWTAALRLLPRPVRDAAYDLVARNRYRLFGRRDHCMIPSADIRNRFITDPRELA